jgi:hypothetical protein
MIIEVLLCSFRYVFGPRLNFGQAGAQHAAPLRVKFSNFLYRGVK